MSTNQTETDKPSPQKKGLFITFEGGEGSGKSSQSEKLYQELIKLGYSVVLTHEPGGTNICDEIRQLLLKPRGEKDGGEVMDTRSELLLYLASRAQHVNQLITPQLNTGKIVICDRFTDATVAYQGFGRKVDLSDLKLINDFAIQGLHPDYTVLLDIEPPIGLERSKSLNKAYATEGKLDRIESEGLAFHERVRQGYLQIAEENPNRVAVYNAADSFEDLQKVILNQIKSWIEKHGISENSRPRKPKSDSQENS